MKAFESNIISIYGERGRSWLKELPERTENISTRFRLRDLKPMSGLTYNYVLAGFQNDTPIVLKIGLDSECLKKEVFALKCFSGLGAVEVLAEETGMILLERVLPGICLETYFPDKDMDAVEIACKVIKRLHQAKIPQNHHFPHITDWLVNLDKNCPIPPDYLQKARKIRDRLLATSSIDVLLHGDLHHGNIVQYKGPSQRSQSTNRWMVIDPKGVIGDAAYEAAAFIRNPISHLLGQKNAHHIIQNRISAFADRLGVSASRISDWHFVQSVLCWVWTLDCPVTSFNHKYHI